MTTESARQNASRSHPETYDYRSPDRYCDIVMKGGITSGVIYPFAVCEIARKYQLRSIGGASAGAIAAVLSAAAEYGRHSKAGGFSRLAALPAWLGGSSNLFDLFQPQKGTKRLYRLFTAPIGGGTGRLTRSILAALEQFFGWALLGLIPGAVLLVIGLALAHGVTRGIWIGVALPILLMGLVAAVVVGVLRSATRALPANRFGLCSGMPGSSTNVTALTPWLDRTIEELAGRDPRGKQPLTFGDLWGGPEGVGRPPNDPAGEPWIRLELMTTNLTQGRPYRLPFETREWYFDPAEFRQLFPERIVRWMEAHPPPLPPPSAETDRRKTLTRQKLLYPLRPLPDAEDLPVVVAARLSLSFPVLISAVPLRTIDWSRTANAQARDRWEDWAEQHSEELERLRPGSLTWARIKDEVGAWPVASPSWFSDGGITSNFPVHFFDAPLPRWPTFAINLRNYHPDHLPTCNRCDRETPCDEHQSVWMPRDNKSGIREGSRDFASGGLKALVEFGHAIIDTMQNWSDNTLTRVPGYRDRVAHVYHTKEEGGLNLSMPTCRIEALAERGRCAAEELVGRFGLPPTIDAKLTWDNHRWVRYRTMMRLLQENLRLFERAWRGARVPGYPLYPAPGEASFSKLLRGGAHAPRSYPLAPASLKRFAKRATQLLLWLSRRWRRGDFSKDAPHPFPELRVRPRV